LRQRRPRWWGPATEITVQMFDPEPEELLAPAISIMIILALILGILFISYRITDIIISYAKELGEKGLNWGNIVKAISYSVPIFAVAYLIRSVRKK